MSISIGKTDVGLVRKNNEDAFSLDDRAGYCALADGMGGAAAGEIASLIFVDTAREIFSEFEDRSADGRYEQVRKAFVSANARMLEHVRVYPGHKGMGCTAELLTFTREGFVLGHMGDSRTYRFRNGELKQLTKDHSFVQGLVDQGIITPDEARVHPKRNVILQALGVNETPSLDIMKGKTLSGDLFLLCSDGLSDMIDDARIQAVLQFSEDLGVLADELIHEAKQGGGKDNVTVVLSRVE